MLLSVNWIVFDGNVDNMRLDDEWIRNFYDLVNGVWNLNFLDDWNFDLLVDWIFLDVVMVNGVNVVRHRDLNSFAVIKETEKLIKCRGEQ